MRRHDTDWISLVAGIVFTLFAVVYLVVGLTDVTIDARFVWPVVLIGLGIGGIATAVRANAREEQAFAAHEQSTLD